MVFRPLFLPGAGLVILQDLAPGDSGSTCSGLKIPVGSCEHLFPGGRVALPSLSIPLSFLYVYHGCGWCPGLFQNESWKSAAGIRNEASATLRAALGDPYVKEVYFLTLV